MAKKKELSEEEIFVNIANFGAVVDKDGVEAGIKALDLIHKRSAVPGADRRRHVVALQNEFQNSDIKDQAKISKRLTNLQAMLNP